MEDPFFRLMALSWLLAEGTLLVFARWAASAVHGEEAPHWKFATFCVCLFFLLGGLAFFGEALFKAWLPRSRRMDLFFYRSFIWNLFCTLWVIIEGLIILYVFRIDRGMGGTVPGRIRFPWAVLLLVVLPLGFFLLYQAQMVSVVGRYHLGLTAASRISRFFIRLCGLFWILFEWVAAFIGLRILHRLRRAGRTA